jgi:anti-sigma-K factor RskA
MEARDRQQQYLEFALGTLEGEEYQEIRNLLERGDAACIRGVAEARALVAGLAHAAPEAAPPARVRERLLAAVAAEAAVGRVAAPSRNPYLAWAIAAGLLVFAVLTSNRARNLEGQLAGLQERFEQLAAEHEQVLGETETYRRLLAIVSAPGTRAVSLNAPQSPQLQAYWNEPLGLVLVGQNVPAPAPDRTLQLWIIPAQGAPIDAGIFRPDASGRALYIASPTVGLSQAAALAITDEPAGGQPQPTTTPIWVGQIG